MKKQRLFSLLLTLFLFNSCTNHSQPKVQIAGAMKNVMWKGELGGIIQLDSLCQKPGMYAVGPLEGLAGEILVWDSKPYVSRLAADSSLKVTEMPEARAPFLVYAQVNDWQNRPLPASIKNLADLESYLDSLAKDSEEPFPFLLEGEIKSAKIHCQNLAPGSLVTNPNEAHAGQVNYELGKSKVKILGFYSRHHQGIFTHHDSFMHMHLMTDDSKMMGHIDRIEFESGARELRLKMAR